MFFEHIRHIPASGPLHWLLPLPGSLSPQKYSWIISSPLSNRSTNASFSMGLPRNTLLSFDPTPPSLLSYSTFHFSLSLTLQHPQTMRFFIMSYTGLSFDDRVHTRIAHGSSSVLLIRTAWSTVGAQKDLLHGWMDKITLKPAFSSRDYNSTIFDKSNYKRGSRF